MAREQQRYRNHIAVFFSSRRRHTRCSRDWSSDVCSSDLGVPFAQVFEERAGLKLDGDVTLQLLGSDLDALNLLIGGHAHAALLPRPYGFMAEERGFERVNQWPAGGDGPLPITLETTRALAQEKEREFAAFLTAHREGIRYVKANRHEAMRGLSARSDLPPGLVRTTCADYLVC